MDRISNLPDNVINLILERLDFVERVGTSALSRRWRFRWTYLSSLALGCDFHEFVCEYVEDCPLKYANLINSLLLQHGCCIREFILYIPINYLSSFSLFEHAIRFATRSSSLETLCLASEEFLTPSTLRHSIFSLENLRCLEFTNFQLNPPSWFKGFPNLTHLELNVNLPTADTMSNFISVCPQLEEVIFEGAWFVDQVLELEAPNLRHLHISGNFKGIVVSKAPILDSVNMCLDHYSDEEAERFDYVFEHFNSFAQVQKLSLGENLCKLLGRCSVMDMLSRFDRLKRLEFAGMDTLNTDVLKCVLSILAASPNVRELKLSVNRHGETEAEADPFNFESLVEKYINEDFRHLLRIELSGVWNTKTYMKVVEWLLRFSPILEMMCLVFAENAPGDAKLKFCAAMLNFHRASTKVKFEIS